MIPVTDTVILKEPWTASCALLVFPGGADLGYCRSLNGDGNRRIAKYVRMGGKYLGFCAGGYYGCGRCEFEVGDKKMEVIGSRELELFPGTCRGCAFKGFQYRSEAGARAAKLKVDKACFSSGTLPDSFRSYYNGGGVFVDAKKHKERGVEILASYTEPMDVDGGDGAAAVVYCKVGDGAAVLTGPHPEFAAVNLDRTANGPGYAEVVDAIAHDDQLRTDFLKGCLLKLGLTVSQETGPVPSLSRLHLSSQNNAEMSQLLESLKEAITVEDGEEYIKGENDTFHIERQNSRWSLHSVIKSLPIVGSGDSPSKSVVEDSDTPSQDGIIDYNKVTKHLVPHEAEWPGGKETPYFNHHAFFANLKAYQEEKSSEAEDFGKLLMYGEVVTSTNTILEKNMKLLSHLPTGFTFTATTQVAGRGRGSNVWVSPAGCLIFSSVINHPVHLANIAPVVFIQYLAAIAIVEGIKSYDHGYSAVPVRLKWPNDIYAADPANPDQFVKIGGILVNSSYSSGNYNLVLGIGLNTTNSAPTTSLNALLPSNLPPFNLEKLLARILTKFESIYKDFCRQGFSRKLEETYYRHWLHTEQIVTLEAEGGIRARVLGITRDWGLLKVEELGWEDRGTGRVVELQSDSNSFDFFKGLVKRKV